MPVYSFPIPYADPCNDYEQLFHPCPSTPPRPAVSYPHGSPDMYLYPHHWRSTTNPMLTPSPASSAASTPASPCFPDPQPAFHIHPEVPPAFNLVDNRGRPLAGPPSRDCSWEPGAHGAQAQPIMRARTMGNFLPAPLHNAMPFPDVPLHRGQQDYPQSHSHHSMPWGAEQAGWGYAGAQPAPGSAATPPQNGEPYNASSLLHRTQTVPRPPPASTPSPTWAHRPNQPHPQHSPPPPYLQAPSGIVHSLSARAAPSHHLRPGARYDHTERLMDDGAGFGSGRRVHALGSARVRVGAGAATLPVSILGPGIDDVFGPSHYSEEPEGYLARDFQGRRLSVATRQRGRKKALLIGINYKGQLEIELCGCINDVLRIGAFLMECGGYNKDDIVVLTDDVDDPERRATKANILHYFGWLVQDAQPGDALFLHFSGHGSQVPDEDDDERDDHLDETILPVDYAEKGPIVDDDLNRILVQPLPRGCRLTALFDACHSGTALDLPYQYASNTDNTTVDLLVGEHRPDKSSAADVILLSGCKDEQTSADTTRNNLDVGAMTSEFIDSLMAKPEQTYWELFNNLGKRMNLDKYEQKPQLSTSHAIDINRRFVF